MAGKADDRMNPEQKLITTVAASPTCGIARLNGAVPAIDSRITYLRPILSPTGPPTRVPAAVAARNTKRKTWESCTLTPNFSIR